MSKGNLIIQGKSEFRQRLDILATLITDGLTSEHSKRAYKRQLSNFLEWLDLQGSPPPPLSKALINRYRAELIDRQYGASNINQAMSAIRKLAREAADNGLLDEQVAGAIGRVEGVKRQGQRTGNWLDQDEAQELLNAPSSGKLKHLRDQAILAVLLGAGLRRTEAASLTFAHIQRREGRWAIVDIVGKKNRVRTVPISRFVKEAIDEWAAAAGLSAGYVFRPLTKGGKLGGHKVTAQCIYHVVSEWKKVAGVNVAPHDLRRTYAKLSYKGGAAIEQVQQTLGHANIATTQGYLGLELDMQNAPSDFLGLSLEDK